MEDITLFWVVTDMLLAISVITASILFIRHAPKTNRFRIIKYWHIFNSAVLIGLLSPVLAGFHWPSWVQFLMIALILANNFAATLGSYDRLRTEQEVLKTVLKRIDTNNKEYDEWKSETLSESQRQ